MTKKEKEKAEIERFTWSLDISLAQFLLPRLRVFKRQYLKSTVENPEGLTKLKLNKMLYSFRAIAKEEHLWATPEQQQKIQEGLDLFAKHYMELWH